MSMNKSWSLLAVLAVSGGVQAQRVTVNRGVVLTGVTVVDTSTGKLTPNMTVVTVDGKITRIARAGTIVAQGATQTIDLRGRYLVPGFWDMHAHPLERDRAATLAVMLSYGITGVRQMSGSDALLAERKAGTLMPSADAPEIVAMPGTLLTRGSATMPATAVALVDHNHDQGADFFKTVDAIPPVFFAALEEANRLHMPFAGHLSPGVEPARASSMGMRSIEHLGPGETILNFCSTDEAALQAGVLAHPPATPQNMPPQATQQMMQLATASPMLARVLAMPSYFTNLQHVLDTQNDAKCLALAKVFVAHQTWQVPTLIRERTMQLSADPQYTEDGNLKFVSPSLRAQWAMAGRLFASKVTPANIATINQLNGLQLHLVKLFESAGVKMLAGSDFGGIWVIPGLSLHQEFDLLAEAGLSPLRVLQMTTLNGAEFMNRTGTDGAVREGEHANLVVLEGNPIESVQNLHRVVGVMRDGRYYDQAALTALQTKAAAELTAAPSSAAGAKVMLTEEPLLEP